MRFNEVGWILKIGLGWKTFEQTIRASLGFNKKALNPTLALGKLLARRFATPQTLAPYLWAFNVWGLARWAGLWKLGRV